MDLSGHIAAFSIIIFIKYADFILTDSKYTFETDTNTEKTSKIIDNIFKNVFGLPEDYIADIRLENCP